MSVVLFCCTATYLATDDDAFFFFVLLGFGWCEEGDTGRVGKGMFFLHPLSMEERENDDERSLGRVSDDRDAQLKACEKWREKRERERNVLCKRRGSE